MTHIFIVEDDFAILDPMKIMLTGEGYKVTGISDGSLILANDYELPDLFIIDKQLSGVDGLDLCRYLKNQDSTKHIPVVMISANPSILRVSKEAMADDALEKPFRMKDLREAVTRLLGAAGPTHPDKG